MDPVDRKEAEEYVSTSPEQFGPHLVADLAEENDIETGLLAGRITLTLEECQSALGIGPSTMRTAVRNGQIPTVMLGGRRMVPIKALERHLTALAYADVGALDQWQEALISAHANRIRRQRRRKLEARKRGKRFDG